MPVTFSPAKIKADAFPLRANALTSADLLRHACPEQHKKSRKVSTIFISFPVGKMVSLTLLESYNRHRALVLRPDDVWLAILLQFNFFVNANAEALRSQFVSHSGQKAVRVDTVDFGMMAIAITKEIEKNVVDPSLRAWIMPEFSTTTINDTIVCSVVMMATLKKYFSWTGGACCGIPRVTLEGEKDDWENILARLEKLKEYGLQTIA